MNDSSVSTVACPLWRRLLALLYDLLAVLAIVMVVGYICQRITGGNVVSGGDHAHIAWWYQPLQGLAVSTYFVLSWLRGGQTLGMRPWRIRVTGSDGRRLTLGQAVLRVLVAAAPLLLLGLAPWFGVAAALWAVAIAWALYFGLAAFDPRRRALQDVIARTELRRIG
ncbi:RDD family protein [Dyella solisilvae]|uniref:RDD family protein n=1 Tax=Dyella solisilvae TaxID=1920168 RepID=A0A370KCI2_9GAMM|nr:RDD family protein [Dyella solisilvae]RDJ00364.1 RDD family protein [Dyella solisilvae]